MLEEKLKQLINLPETYIGEAPIAVDNCQWIRTSGGSSSVYFGKNTYDKPTFSIYVRDKNNAIACERIKDIYKKIQNYSNGISSLLISRMPSFVGKDEKHRSIYTLRIEYQTGEY